MAAAAAAQDGMSLTCGSTSDPTPATSVPGQYDRKDSAGRRLTDRIRQSVSGVRAELDNRNHAIKNHRRQINEWKYSRVQDVALSICSEIQNSLSPAALMRWVTLMRYREEGTKLVELFCFASWLLPHITDDAEVGVYSKTLTARVYRAAAKEMPRMILLSAFGAEPDLHNMRGFMRQWEQAEKMLTGEDYAVLGNLDEKDMGPFLFWLLNERASLCASFLFCPSSPSENSDDFSPPLCGMHELRPPLSLDPLDGMRQSLNDRDSVLSLVNWAEEKSYRSRELRLRPHGRCRLHQGRHGSGICKPLSNRCSIRNVNQTTRHHFRSSSVSAR